MTSFKKKFPGVNRNINVTRTFYYTRKIFWFTTVKCNATKLYTKMQRRFTREQLHRFLIEEIYTFKLTNTNYKSTFSRIVYYDVVILNRKRTRGCLKGNFLY